MTKPTIKVTQKQIYDIKEEAYNVGKSEMYDLMNKELKRLQAEIDTLREKK